MGDRTTLPIEKADVDFVLSDLSNLRYDALQAELKKRGLDTSGDKQELVKRFSEVLQLESLENEKIIGNPAETPEILGQIGTVIEEPDSKTASDTIEDRLKKNDTEPSGAKSRSFAFAGSVATIFSNLAKSTTTPNTDGIPEAQGGIEQPAVGSGDDRRERNNEQETSQMLQEHEQILRAYEKKHQMEIDRLREMHARHLADVEARAAAELQNVLDQTMEQPIHSPQQNTLDSHDGLEKSKSTNGLGFQPKSGTPSGTNGSSGSSDHGKDLLYTDYRGDARSVADSQQNPAVRSAFGALSLRRVSALNVSSMMTQINSKILSVIDDVIKIPKFGKDHGASDIERITEFVTDASVNGYEYVFDENLDLMSFLVTIIDDAVGLGGSLLCAKGVSSGMRETVELLSDELRSCVQVGDQFENRGHLIHISRRILENPLFIQSSKQHCKMLTAMLNAVLEAFPAPGGAMGLTWPMNISALT